MRDQWDLSGEEIAVATGWAMRTLLQDLKLRGVRPLDDAFAPETDLASPT